MDDLSSLILYLEACLPDSELGILERALIVHAKLSHAAISAAELSALPLGTALQTLRTVIDAGPKHVGTIAAAVRGRIGLGLWRTSHQVVYLDLFRLPNDTCPPHHGRLVVSEVNQLLEQDNLRMEEGRNALVEPDAPGFCRELLAFPDGLSMRRFLAAPSKNYTRFGKIAEGLLNAMNKKPTIPHGAHILIYGDTFTDVMIDQVFWNFMRDGLIEQFPTFGIVFFFSYILGLILLALLLLLRVVSSIFLAKHISRLK